MDHRYRNRWYRIIALVATVFLILSWVVLASSVDVAVVDVTAPVGSVTLAPGESGPITITLTVTGNQEGTATFKVYRDWVLSGGVFTGSNYQEFTVAPRDAQDPPTVFNTSGTVTVASSQTTGTFTLAVSVFDITNSNKTGAKLSAGTPSNYQVTVSAPADTTPPTTSIALSPATPNGNNGWYVTNVHVTVSATDNVGGSGVAETRCVLDPASAPTSFDDLPASCAYTGAGADVTTEGQHIVYAASKDNAGNIETPKSASFKIDKTPPSITASAMANGNPYTAGTWTNKDVTVSYSCSDNGGSGIASCGPTPQVYSTEGAGQSSTGTAVDNAGNSASVTFSPINIDKTSPTLTKSLSGTAGNAPWWKSDVTVTLTGGDTGGSGLASVEYNLNGAGWTVYTGPFTISTEGTNTLEHRATDGAGNVYVLPSQEIKIDKTPPTITASAMANGSPYTAGTWTNKDVTVSYSCSDNGGSGIASCGPTPQVYNTEGAGQSSTGTAVDNAGNSASVTFSPINIDKTPPMTKDVTANPNPVAVNINVTLQATLTDALSGVASAEYSLNGGMSWSLLSGLSPWNIGSFGSACVLNVCVRATDAAGNTGAPECILLAVYDPSAGFVTGGGWINSPAGAYMPDPSLTGKATFGFVSKYQKGATVPTGNTEFQFHVANFRFKSTSYEWLVVAGAKAQYKGSGTVNGAGDYGFLLTAIDGQLPGGGGADKFRIKIWDRATGNIIYDNQMGAGDTADPTTVLGGGSIVIHK